MLVLLERIFRAAKLDADLYEEVEAEGGAMAQAILVVLFSSLAAGIGSPAESGFKGIITGTIMSLAAWFFWSLLIFLIGTKLLPEPQTRSDYGELLRTIGFASAPGLILILGLIPLLNWTVITIVATIWTLAAMIVAVRQALDYTNTWRAVAVCVLGWVTSAAYIFFSRFFLGGPS